MIKQNKTKPHVWSLCLHSFSHPMSYMSYILCITYSLLIICVNRLQNSQHRKDWASFMMVLLFIAFRAGGNFSSQNLKELVNQNFVWSTQYCGKMQDGRKKERNIIYIACTFQIFPFSSSIPLTAVSSILVISS